MGRQACLLVVALCSTSESAAPGWRLHVTASWTDALQVKHPVTQPPSQYRPLRPWALSACTRRWRIQVALGQPSSPTSQDWPDHSNVAVSLVHAASTAYLSQPTDRPIQTFSMPLLNDYVAPNGCLPAFLCLDASSAPPPQPFMELTLGQPSHCSLKYGHRCCCKLCSCHSSRIVDWGPSLTQAQLRY